MKLKRIELTLFLLMAMLALYSAGTAVMQVRLSDQVVRLRVIANSDDFTDQSQKLLVRNAILAQCEAIIPDDADADTVKNAVQDNLDALAQSASDAVGGKYPVFLRLSESRYPTRSYRGFALPAGRYVGLQVFLGEARGKNWWCVLYPSLCVSCAESDCVFTDQQSFSFKSAELLSAFCEKIWS